LSRKCAGRAAARKIRYEARARNERSTRSRLSRAREAAGSTRRAVADWLPARHSRCTPRAWPRGVRPVFLGGSVLGDASAGRTSRSCEPSCRAGRCRCRACLWRVLVRRRLAVPRRVRRGGARETWLRLRHVAGQSGTGGGVLRRRAEARWLCRPEDHRVLAAGQSAESLGWTSDPMGPGLDDGPLRRSTSTERRSLGVAHLRDLAVSYDASTRWRGACVVVAHQARRTA
jgi:hypothetical protein